MANHKSTKKSIRKNVRSSDRNTQRTSRIKTFVTKVETAIAEGKKSDAQAAFQAAQPELMRGVTKGVYKLNTVSRKLSRLSAKIKALA
jgi:small subunit ribosomal protein S20